MAAKDDDESAREEGNQRIVELALEAAYKGCGKGEWSFGKGQSWDGNGHNGGKGGKDGGKNSWQKGNGKKGGTAQEKGGKGETRASWTCGKQDILQLGVEKVATEICMPLKKRTVSMLKNYRYRRRSASMVSAGSMRK